MNRISKLAKIGKNVKLGINNFIGDNVKIWDDVELGDNNQIFENTIIYPNTKIGNNNVILNYNIIGEYGVEAKHDFTEKKFGGLEIGNNNYFHIKNIIYNGYHNKTKIGNSNKILSEITIHHDCILENNIFLYPRAMLCGKVSMQSNSGLGANSVIQQNSLIGEYSFGAMLNPIVKNCFPFFIYKNAKVYRMNYHRVPKEWHKYEKQLLEKNLTDLPHNILDIIKKFDENIKLN